MTFKKVRLFSVTLVNLINGSLVFWNKMKIEKQKTKILFLNFSIKIENWKLSLFSFQFWIKIEIHENVIFHSNFKMKIEWHFRWTDYPHSVSIFIKKWTTKYSSFFIFTKELKNELLKNIKINIMVIFSSIVCTLFKSKFVSSPRRFSAVQWSCRDQESAVQKTSDVF